MFDALLKSKFYSKCKSDIKLTKTRIEMIKRKRNAMQKFLKKDVADLLNNGLDSNAYGRVEGLYVEQNLTRCYEFVEQSCLLVLSNLSAMYKHRECPEECKEAIASLMFAAARFANLPELRELRTLFSERYGNCLEPFVSREFVKKLKADPPTKEMKLQLMQEIALESGLEWDSKALEQKLCQPPPPIRGWSQNAIEDRDNGSAKTPFRNGREAKLQETKVKEKEVHTCGNALPFKSRAAVETRKEENHDHGRVSPYWSSNASSSNESMTSPEYSTGPDSASEDVVEGRKFFGFRSMAPPYIKTDSSNKGTSSDTSSSSGWEEEVAASKHKDNNLRQEELPNSSKPVPRSVRRRPSKPAPSSHANNTASKTNGETGDHVHRDEKEKKMDKLLLHYSRKASKFPADPDMKNSGCKDGRVPTRAGSLPAESLANPAAMEERKGLARAAAYQPNSALSPPLVHVHPKLPDYDDFVARLASLRASS